MNEALKDEEFDVVLLSTSISGQNFYPVIDKYKESIIILLVSYVSNDTVTNPLKMGANDYIVKPFMIEELIKKIEHQMEFKRLTRDNENLRKYIDSLFVDQEISMLSAKTRLPVVIKTNFQKSADAVAFDFIKKRDKPFTFVSLSKPGYSEAINSANPNSILYITNLQKLKKSEKERVLKLVKNKQAILSTTDIYEDFEIASITIQSNNKIVESGDILSIDDYIKFIILNFQNKFPDTELSKKLGISRKSLWERRKKYGILKKK
jgi:DNA-binding NtrC family response regulator